MNIYVGNLPLGVTEDELREQFVTFGQVTSVRIVNASHAHNGPRLGYGYVEMASKREGETAVISLNGKRLHGQMINVISALPLSPRKV